MACNWFHILDLNLDRFLFYCYRFQHDKAERGQECWALTVKYIWFSTGFGHTEGVTNQNALISLFKQRSTDVVIQHFTESISTNGKITIKRKKKRKEKKTKKKEKT